MRLAVAALVVVAVLAFASLAGCQKRAAPEGGGVTGMRPGKAGDGGLGKGDGDSKMTAPRGPESGTVESRPDRERVAGSVGQQMKDVVAPGFSALSKAVKSGDLAAAKPSTEALVAAAETLDTADGAPKERASLDEFIGYRDDLVAAADNLLAAIKSDDSAAAEAGAQDLRKCCDACHKQFRKTRR